ncbi:MAG: hypothetical protein IJS21_03765, partial [Deltaproteobacteria bacterium]|nr:hypothetical protein [Deltaproteobacteria bacterium]
AAVSGVTATALTTVMGEAYIKLMVSMAKSGKDAAWLGTSEAKNELKTYFRVEKERNAANAGEEIVPATDDSLDEPNVATSWPFIIEEVAEESAAPKENGTNADEKSALVEEDAPSAPLTVDSLSGSPVVIPEPVEIEEKPKEEPPVTKKNEPSDYTKAKILWD